MHFSIIFAHIPFNDVLVLLGSDIKAAKLSRGCSFQLWMTYLSVISVRLPSPKKSACSHTLSGVRLTTARRYISQTDRRTIQGTDTQSAHTAQQPHTQHRESPQAGRTGDGHTPAPLYPAHTGARHTAAPAQTHSHDPLEAGSR